MPLLPGTRLGAYEVVSSLGSGGMGEVYRARDTKLGRDVALKVVSAAFTLDPERAARFEREAQLLAALNHPHIASIYGLEQHQNDQFLVMELVDGETLAQRLAGGAFAVPEAQRIAAQIADALHTAHEKGIIHRDLKPANIALTGEGQVKVLDFGLAKALDTSPLTDTANSPTLTLAATQAGVILGTAAYMAPEQAKGKPADRRSDLWAFGCVFYEMLTGRRAFEGEDASDTMAAVLRGEPDWQALPPDVPPPVSVLLRRCLEKDRRARLIDAGAACFVLREFAAMPPPAVAAAPAGRTSWRRVAMLAAAMLALAAAAALGVWVVARPETPRIARFVISAAPSAPVAVSPTNLDIAVSPDGSRIVYRSGNPALLHIRDLSRLDSAPLPGTENAVDPFFSPDGRWIAYWAGGFIRKVSVQGGPPVSITTTAALRGGTWGSNDTIVFANAAGVLYRVPAAGGDPVQLTPNSTPDQPAFRARRWPHLLPDGRSLLFTSGLGQGAGDQLSVAILDLDTMEERSLFAGTAAKYLPSGHIVFGVEGALRAVPFNGRRREAGADATVIIDGVMSKASGAIDFDVAADGSLVYVTGGSGVGGQQALASIDRQGRATPLPGVGAGSYRDVRISPDGRRLAVGTFDDVWTYDFARATMSRLTTNPAGDRSPLWTPDSQRIIFSSTRAGYPELFSRVADGTGPEDRLYGRSKDLIDLRANGWSADGRHLLFTEVPPTILCAIGHVDPERPSESPMLVKNEFCNDYAAVSPDGQWIAYDSLLSGRIEIYVERYPGGGGRQQISTGGGRLPLWSANGRELYFITLDAREMMVVPIVPGAALVAGQPRVLFEGAFLAPQTGFRPYDVDRNGRFIVIRSGGEGTDTTAPNLVLVQQWMRELTRLVPAN